MLKEYVCWDCDHRFKYEDAHISEGYDTSEFWGAVATIPTRTICCPECESENVE